MKKIPRPDLDNTAWQEGVRRGRAKLFAQHIEPFIQAIMRPDLEEVHGLNKLSTQELVKVAESFPDETILGLAMEKPGQPGVYGFILNPRAFDVAKSAERLAEIMAALLKRFAEAQKNKSDWEKYVCQLRRKM